MNKNIQNILTEKITLHKISKSGIYSNILKSIKQNNNINNSVALYCTMQHQKILKKKPKMSSAHKVCFYTGKMGGVYKNINLSRHTLKKLIIGGVFTNVKKSNW